jgi:hypothetical protein
MQTLFPNLYADLEQLGKRVGASAANGIHHRAVVELLEDLLSDHYQGLALCLAHPTRRLLAVLVSAVARAENAIGWLIRNPPVSRASAPSQASAATGVTAPTAPAYQDDYAVACERIRNGIADWRLALDLCRAFHDLEQGLAETLN